MPPGERLWPYASNTGLINKRVPAIDIDIMSSDAADAIEALAREQFEERGAILVRYGKAPKRAILLRTDEPFKKIVVNFIAPNGEKEKIEILADGQQVVVDGIHPDTGKPYSWFGGSPGNVAREDLPYVREADLQRFIEEAAAILVNDFGYTRVVERPKANGPAGQTGQGGGNAAADWAWLTEAILQGHEVHDSDRDLAGKLVTSGMHPGAAVNYLRGLLQRSQAPRNQRWQDRYDDIPRLVDSAGADRQQQQIALPFVNMSTWDTDPAPEQDWAVLNRIPQRQCVLFSGEGAAGKSTLQLHLSVAHVLGRDWLGTMPALGPALFVDAEDDTKVMHRRLVAITKHYSVTFAELIKSGLHLISLVGHDAVLATVSRGGKVEPTPLYGQLLQAAGDIKPVMIGLASSANFYAGSEIDRAQVQQFISLMTRLALLANGSLVLISHPSLTGIRSDTGLSGNTQWHNAVRARFYMKGVTPEDGEQADSDAREIVFKKNNYGPVAERILLRWRNGLFLPEAGMSGLEKVAREAKADELFLALLRRFSGQGRNVSDKPQANNYAPIAFADEADAKSAKLRKSDFESAMRRLFADNKICREPYGPPSRRSNRIAACG